MSIEIGLGEKIRIGFSGFHRDCPPVHNNLVRGLAPYFPLSICELEKGEVPDFLFVSVFGSDGYHLAKDASLIENNTCLANLIRTCPEAYGDLPAHLDPRYDRCVKIFTCEENLRPPWQYCNYALTGDRVVAPGHEHQHLRLPIYARRLLQIGDWTGRTLVKPPGRDPAGLRTRKTKFCNFVYSNDAPAERRLFFEMLSAYKRVDSGGAVLNNLGTRVESNLEAKLEMLSAYKFTIAFENSRYPGYVTEKIVDPMAVGSLPIYWGDRHIGLDFNSRSFVDANEPEGRDLRSHFEYVVERVAYLDQNDEAYDAMVAEPWFEGNAPNNYCRPDYLVPFMTRVFNSR